jgi:hypothetical protein
VELSEKLRNEGVACAVCGITLFETLVGYENLE